MDCRAGLDVVVVGMSPHAGDLKPINLLCVRISRFLTKCFRLHHFLLSEVIAEVKVYLSLTTSP
jgi:hypothetical protein